jgi:hypothetical protein
MKISLIEIYNHAPSVQFEFSILTMVIGETHRSLFSFWIDGGRKQIDFLFIHFPFFKTE